MKAVSTIMTLRKQMEIDAETKRSSERYLEQWNADNNGPSIRIDARLLAETRVVGNIDPIAEPIDFGFKPEPQLGTPVRGIVTPELKPRRVPRWSALAPWRSIWRR